MGEAKKTKNSDNNKYKKEKSKSNNPITIKDKIEENNPEIQNDNKIFIYFFLIVIFLLRNKKLLYPKIDNEIKRGIDNKEL